MLNEWHPVSAEVSTFMSFAALSGFAARLWMVKPRALAVVS